MISVTRKSLPRSNVSNTYLLFSLVALLVSRVEPGVLSSLQALSSVVLRRSSAKSQDDDA